MFWKWKKGEQSIQDKQLLTEEYLNFFRNTEVINFKFPDNEQNKFKKFSASQILAWIERTNRLIYRSIQQGKTKEEILRQFKI